MNIVIRCIPPIYLMSGMIIAVMKKTEDCSGLPIAQIVDGNPRWMGDIDYSYFYREMSECLRLQNKTWSDLEGRWLYKHR